MQVNITARHLELTPALAGYVRKKVEKFEHFFDHLVWAQVILTVEKYRQLSEIIIHGGNTTFRSKEESIDLYAAIDLSLDKIEKQLHKYKEKTKEKRKGKIAAEARRPLAGKRGAKRSAAVEAEAGRHLISEVKRVDVKPSSIREAIDEMELLGYAFYMFLNADTSQINVIYSRDNGSYGLIEPEL